MKKFKSPVSILTSSWPVPTSYGRDMLHIFIDNFKSQQYDCLERSCSLLGQDCLQNNVRDLLLGKHKQLSHLRFYLYQQTWTYYELQKHKMRKKKILTDGEKIFGKKTFERSLYLWWETFVK